MQPLIKVPIFIVLVLSSTFFTVCASRSEETKPIKASLTDKIAQLLIVGFRGLSVDEKSPIVRDIQKHNVGGVLLFDYDLLLKKSKRNIKSPKQVKLLIEQLQSFSRTPLFIAIDQEGGKIQRLKPKFGFPRTVSAQYLGKQHKPERTYKQASKIAQTLEQLGINFNLAPVVDLNLNPNNPVVGKLGRSFSADPHIVTQHAIEFIKAHHAHGVLTALKHFPGHGSSAADSHQKWTDVTNTWQESELQPYREIISAGMADAVMVAHIFNKNMDPSFPASFSKEMITNKLRRELNFEGVVVSDDIQMKAIIGHYSFKSAIQFLIEAGVDIIVIGNNLEYDKNIVPHTVAVIEQLIEEGKITPERINESYTRIQRLKSSLFDHTLPLEPLTEPVEKPQKEKYKLTVEVIPSDSRIRIVNIVSRPYSPGIELEPGFYDIDIRQHGYKNLRFWIKISDKNLTVPVILEKKTCPGNTYSLIVNASPPDSRIRIMNIRAPYQPGICLRRGKYKISVTRRGYLKHQKWIKLNSDRFVEISLKHP